MIVDELPEPTDEMKECEECGGEGWVEAWSSCTRRISGCCGGCVRTCPSCSVAREEDAADDDDWGGA